MSNVQSVERALIILETLSQAQRGMSVKEISNKVDLAKSTTHRLLTTLMSKGYVIQNNENDDYLLGLKLVEISSSILENLDIRSYAKDALEHLSDVTNESVHLCIHENGEVVYIDKFEGNHTIRMHSRIGKRGMMHCTGVGKILLSGMTEEEISNIIRKKGLPKLTSKTITDTETLYKRLEKIRADGYDIDDIENEEGIRCMAAPIFNHRGEIIAAFSISGPEMRITKERIESELKKLILETSTLISQKMGYTR
ncbi:IclR family transcriptional regulator [Pseudogracilibacillus sp. SE30717A]|uniref:IclR family transcriptional regulator n=1 Tax=Pseudogracilibacillus sp. SE30717A TaxID=3098293 RepID=UPI00300E0AB2